MADLENMGSLSDEDFLSLDEDMASQEQMTEAEDTDPVGSIEDDEPVSSPADDPDAEDTPIPAEYEEEEPAVEKQYDTLEEQLDAEANATASEDHTKAKQTKAEEEDEESEEAAQSDDPDASTAVNFEAEYKKIMAPFKASGRTVEPKTPEEAVRLMQMGADYTKKMTSLKPVLKIARMLENNGLIDEEKISYLIDLNRRDPAAIQKLIHDSKIDPLDLNVSEEPAYKPSNYNVTDQEMQFHDVLGDLTSTPDGVETVNLINSSWDQTSKQAVYDEPMIMQIINEQRANGIFDQISAEMDRQKMLGNISPNTPFLQAYKQVGDHLQAQQLLKPVSVQGEPALAPTPATASAPQPAPRVMGTRPANVRTAQDNGDRVRAASPTRTAPKSSPKTFNLFELSDEEIEAIKPPA